MAASIRDIAWLAGLLEGEGCFFAGYRKVSGRVYRRILIQLIMTDEEPVAQAASIMGIPYSLSLRTTKGGKSIYRTNAYGAKAASWMMMLYPFMHTRRKSKIKECLQVWRVMPGKGPNQFSQAMGVA